MGAAARPVTCLVFGFEPFAEHAVNPSQLVVEALARDGRWPIVARVLPTEYERAGAELERWIRETRPDVVLGVGLAAARETPCLERLARNVDDADSPDNAGVVRCGVPIEPSGPAELATTADLAPILERLAGRGLAAEISDDAGAFVCNHAYFVALRALRAAGSDAACLFVHVPDAAHETVRCVLEALLEQRGVRG